LLYTCATQLRLNRITKAGYQTFSKPFYTKKPRTSAGLFSFLLLNF
jgi:hypothetical protein